MPATVLDGELYASQITAEVAAEVRQLATTGVRPGLAVLQVGADPASAAQVQSKINICNELGIYSEAHALAATSSTDELVEQIETLNGREEIDGIVLQQPLPAPIDAKRVLQAIAPQKDVDGFHPINAGNLSMQRPSLLPCIPAACMEILKRAAIAIEGQEAVIVGCSDVMGKPMAMLLLNANATVTICHDKTRDLPAVCRRGDILVAAVDKPGFITTEFIKPGATILDVGIHRVTDAVVVERFLKGDEKREKEFADTGSTLMGDCDPRVVRMAGAVTPVPGGVGQMTLAMLMSNTIKAAKLRRAVKAAETPA